MTVEFDLRKKAAQSIVDFGPVIDLRLGEGESLGSLHRIYENLETLGSSNDDLAIDAKTALEALKARERVNGSDWERQHQQEFAELTGTARTKLQTLFGKISTGEKT